MRWPGRPDVRLLRGVALGLALAFLVPLAINKTVAADWAVGPLLVADDAGPADAIVVLGAGVIGDCGANRYAVRRVLHGTRLWRQHQAPFVMFTGGRAGDCTAAEAMAALARDIGVPTDAIRVERASQSTRENATMTAPLLRGWGVRRILLVTDRLHMRRAAAVFRQQGFEVRPISVPVFEGHDDNVEMLRFGLREYLALAYYRARGWIGQPDDANATAERVPVPSMASARTANHGPIVLLGASYAHEWPLPAVADVPVLNRGVGGDVTVNMLARFDSDVVAAAPRAVIIWGLINDITRAPADSMDETLAGIRDHYTTMVARARQHGIEPVLATEVTLGPTSGVMMEAIGALVGRLRGRVSYQDRINAQVVAANRWLRELADREGLLLLHLQSALAGEHNRRQRPFTKPDGSHITPEGYDALTAYALPILEEFLRVR